MKKFLLLLCLIFNFNLYSAQVSIEPSQLKSYMQYCFAGQVAIDMDEYTNGITVDSRQNGQVWTIRYGEIVILCQTESYYLNNPVRISPISHELYRDDVRRGVSDLCLGTDWVIGWEGTYTCVPSEGIFKLMPHSVYESGDFPECIETLSNGKDNIYPASSMIHLNLTKYTTNTYTHTDSYYWNSYSCSKNIDPNSPDTGGGDGSSSSGSSGSPGTNTGGGGSSGSGSGSGTTDNTAVLNKIDTLASDLKNIKDTNSNTKDILVNKLDTANTELNLTRDDISTLKTDISSKLIDLNTQLETIKAENNSLKTNLNEKLETINTQNTNLKNDMSNIKNSIDDLALDTATQTNQLQSSLEEKIANDIETYGNIINRLNNLDSQLSGLSSSIDNLGTGSGSGNGTDLSGIGTGLTNIDNTLKSNLQDNEGKPFLKSISDNLSNMFKPLSADEYGNAQSDINSSISSSLNDSFSKYSNVLGFGSNYGTAPSNITVNLMGQTYTLLNFSVLDNYVYIIRSLFLSLAYLYGFMNLIRGNK